MATAANIQITCKISEVPKSKMVNGLVEFYLTENNQAVLVRAKPKSTTPPQADGVWKMCHSQTYGLDGELIPSLQAAGNVPSLA